MSLAQKIRSSKESWERKPQDFYPTPPEVTQALLSRCLMTAGENDSLLIREPCCGEGHMSEVLKRNGHTVVSSDIEHTGYGTGGVDYLATKESDGREYEFDCVITNPPFSSGLPEKIIRRALRDAPFVAILLPSGYWHSARRAKLFYDTRPIIVLNLTWRPAFLEAERGKSPLMNVIWTIWADDTVLPPGSKAAKLNGKTLFDLLEKPIEVAPIDTHLTRLEKSLDRLSTCFDPYAGL